MTDDKLSASMSRMADLSWHQSSERTLVIS
jgi:hypothetical protein